MREDENGENGEDGEGGVSFANFMISGEEEINALRVKGAEVEDVQFVGLQFSERCGLKFLGRSP